MSTAKLLFVSVNFSSPIYFYFKTNMYNNSFDYGRIIMRVVSLRIFFFFNPWSSSCCCRLLLMLRLLSFCNLNNNRQMANASAASTGMGFLYKGFNGRSSHQFDVTNQFANPKFQLVSFYLFVSTLGIKARKKKKKKMSRNINAWATV